MALTKCVECKKEISTKAKGCPNCGAKVARVGILGKIIIGFVLFAIAITFVGDRLNESDRAEAAAKEAARATAAREAETKRLAAMTPEQRAAEVKKRQESEQRQAQERKRLAETKKNADAAVQRAALGAQILKKSMRDPESFKLESALVIEKTGAVCYDYRARNGFGGINVGHAVLGPDGKKFMTNEMEGFSAFWNRECANKPGQEVSTAIRWFAL